MLAPHLYDVDAPLGCVANTAPQGQFPRAFKDHLREFLSSPFARSDDRDGKWMRNLNPNSLEVFVWAAAQALVGDGVDPRLLVCLDDLLSARAFKKILDFYSDDRAFAFYVGISLLRVAQFCKTVQPDTVLEMRRIASSLAPVLAGD